MDLNGSPTHNHGMQPRYQPRTPVPLGSRSATQKSTNPMGSSLLTSLRWGLGPKWRELASSWRISENDLRLKDAYL